MKVAESVIVSVDFSHGKESGILIVGRQTGGTVTIVNAFQGEEAEELYKKLITPPLKRALSDFNKKKVGE